MAVIYSIRVQHRDELENILPSQDSGPGVVLSQQEAYEPVHDEGGAGLPRVNPCRHEDSLLARKHEGSASRLIREYFTAKE